MTHRFALALRTRGGAQAAGVDPGALAEVVDAGLIRIEGGCIVLTPAGRLLATEVTLRLAPVGAPPRDADRRGLGTR